MTFFQGWRRKLGAAALVTACALAAMWMRNRFVVDNLQITITDKSEIAAHSMYDSIQIIYRRHHSFSVPLTTRPVWFQIDSRPVTRHDRGVWDPWKTEITAGDEVHADLNSPVLRYLKMTYASRDPSEVDVTTIVLADLPVTFLLTLLSAYLLITPRSKPNRSDDTPNPPKQPEPR